MDIHDACETAYRNGHEAGISKVLLEFENFTSELENDYLYTEDVIYAINILKERIKEIK